MVTSFKLSFFKIKKLSLLPLFLFLFSQTFAQKIPHLEQKGSFTQLIVEGEPYLILGGELGNSTASDLDYLSPAWPKMEKMNINTVLAPVNWELIEKDEGQFDFSLVDGLIVEARKWDMKLVLLWFGSWKKQYVCLCAGLGKERSEAISTGDG